MSRVFQIGLLLVCLILLAACRDGENAPATSPAETNGGVISTEIAPGDPAVTESAPLPPPTPTMIPPSPTPLLAAMVNGEPILLATYETALAQRDAGLFGALDPDLPAGSAEMIVLDMLIEQVLIAQAAAGFGINIDEATVAAEMAQLRLLSEEAGGPGAYEAWLQINGWTESDLEAALRQQLLTERVMDRITADVPEAVPQAHARYLQVDNPALADSIREQVLAGADFAALAREHSLDRATGEDGGDLGYFPAGTLLVPEVEAAAFALQPEQVSEIIAVTDPESGQTIYYLVQLIALDPARPLTAEGRGRLLQESFEAWLAEQMAAADIVTYVGVENGG
jgi:parvulin-like peptidyl-prolyl isomerase